MTDFTFDDAIFGRLDFNTLGGARPPIQSLVGGLKPIHDFNKFPELRNSQMESLYYESPHKQITEDFYADVINVHDGDTITIRWSDRDFDFPVRFLDINAPELSEAKGNAIRDWLKERIEGEEVQILINSRNRVDKWGRLLGHIFHRGLDVGREMMNLGLVTSFESREEGKIPNIDKEVNIKKWV